MPTNFIGIDLAWKSDQNPTTVVVLSGGRSGANLCSRSDRLTSTEAILSFVLEHSGPDSVVAIDAPLIITNESGQRACETLVGKEYSAREASCHTSNLRLYPSASSVKLALALLRQGYNHALTVSRCRGLSTCRFGCVVRSVEDYKVQERASSRETNGARILPRYSFDCSMQNHACSLVREWPNSCRWIWMPFVVGP